MEIRQLRTFQTVANLLSFNKAARLLNYAQSSISAQIKALEDDLGVLLFDRLEKKIVLTEAGRKLLDYANRIVDLAEETRSEVTGDQHTRGHINLRVPESMSSYRLVPVINRFHREFPETRLTLSNCDYHDLKQHLSKGLYDLGFLYTDSFLAKDLSIEMLGLEQLVIVAHPDHPLVAKPSIKAKDLEMERILFCKTECSYRMMFQQLLASSKVVPKKIMEVNNFYTIKELVMAGTGLTIAPRISIARELERKEITILPWHDGELEIQMLMIWYTGKWISPALKTFMQYTQEAFTQ